MIQTLNKHVKWRKDKETIFICDCKRLIDLKIPFKYLEFMEKTWRGLEKEKLSDEEKRIFSDFERMKLLSNLEIKKIESKNFNNAIKILDEELGKKRVRNKEFLFKKFKEHPEFFIGAFLDNELIGVICGFPREDYLLISELTVLSKFQNRGFGKKLVEKFENIAKQKKYTKINVGAEDKSVYFYESLKYRPFLLIQFKKGEYSKEYFKDLDLIREYEYDNNQYVAMEIKINKCDTIFLSKLRKKYPQAYFQYIFTKSLF